MPRARLAPASVTQAGAELADEIGLDHLSMGVLAERLGVKTPSLYKHIDSRADLLHRIGVLAMTEFADAVRDATPGWSGTDALTAGAWAMRTYVQRHPGRYAALNRARANDPDDPLIAANDRVLDSWAARLRGYRIAAGQQIHALRMLRSVLHGSTMLEMAGGFQIATGTDESFTWTINFIDKGLWAVAAVDRDGFTAQGSRLPAKA